MSRQSCWPCGGAVVVEVVVGAVDVDVVGAVVLLEPVSVLVEPEPLVAVVLVSPVVGACVVEGAGEEATVWVLCDVAGRVNATGTVFTLSVLVCVGCAIGTEEVLCCVDVAWCVVFPVGEVLCCPGVLTC